MTPEIPELYDVARRVTHELGGAWTDPRTNVAYPPPCAECGYRKLRHCDHVSIDDADPIAHTSFYLLACGVCRTVVAFPVDNLALVTARARRELHLELAARGWWLPFDPEA